MISRKNLFFLIVSSFWFVSLLFFAPVSVQKSHASGTQTISQEVIEIAGNEFLSKSLPWDKESLQIETYYDGEEIELPAGRLDLIFKMPGTKQNAGRIPLTLQINVDDKYQKRVRLTSRVTVTQNVIKTTKSLRRGKLITSDDVFLETIETEKPFENAITNLKNVVGFEAGRNLSKGKIIIASNLKKPALGNKGDKILILAEKGTMKITTPGILKEDGYEDSMVQVLNMESKKIIYGKLVDANTVKVNF